MNFGEFLRQKRLDLELTLRAFCSRFGFDTAYISRLENNKLKPPSSKDKLAAIANALGLKEESSERVKFFDLAYQARKELPPDIKKEAPEIIASLPAFLRKTDGRVKKSKVEALVSFLNRIDDADHEKK